MKVYSTYQEAKIANPNSDIYYTGGIGFTAASLIGTVGSELCDPADYCISLEGFLRDAMKLSIGDFVLSRLGVVIEMDHWGLSHWNNPIGHASKHYILRAKALEEIKIGLTGGDDRNELKPSCRIESYVPQKVESLAGGIQWKNGDDCVWCGVDAVFIGHSKSHKSRCAIEYLRNNRSIIDTVFISDLRTRSSQQREERDSFDKELSKNRIVNQSNSEQPNSSTRKVSAILTLVEEVYGSGALFAVADLLEKYDGKSW